MTATITTLERRIPKISLERLMQASGSFEYRFDELSIEIEDDFCAGRFDGTATVTYWFDPADGLEFFVGDITLECTRWNGGGSGSGRWDVRHVTLEQDTSLYLAIWGVLTDGSHKDAIEARAMGEL